MSKTIKKALAICAEGAMADHTECPYFYEKDCPQKLMTDALAYIETLEERLKADGECAAHEV